MSRAHEAVVDDQFGPRAKAYVESAVHSAGRDLEALDALVAAARPRHALDLGCGGGHVAYRLAKHAERVTASDLSAEMLAAVRATAKDKGLVNIETQQAPAEKLPFADGTFDFLGCRYSAHHWRRFPVGIREARRVLKAGAPAVFIDAYAPGEPLFDTHIQAVELLRDTSHVRDYTLSEWSAALEAAGFAVRALTTWQLRMDYPVWIARMRTPDDNARAIRALQTAASAEVREHFAIEQDGSFMLDIMMMETVAA
ncbi:MAG: methyltransferase domain-containing protein [Proteobacteria bacterium]|nr:methyltransferase domain-containing protein [Pseudomonadota bacterium]